MAEKNVLSVLSKSNMPTSRGTGGHDIQPTKYIFVMLSGFQKSHHVAREDDGSYIIQDEGSDVGANFVFGGVSDASLPEDLESAVHQWSKDMHWTLHPSALNDIDDVHLVNDVIDIMVQADALPSRT